MLLVVGGAAGYIYYLTARSLPLVEGTARLSGLSASVEVIRDRFGVPHLFGSDLRDLARAQGFVHAQDRLFQMELSRRSGAGTLAEVFGSQTLSQDRRARRLGLQTAAAAELNRMAPEAREVLEAYAAGVNAYLTENADRLPPELTLAGIEPAPWQPLDSLTIGRLLASGLTGNGDAEILRSRLVDALGPEAAYRLTGLEPPADAAAAAAAAAATSPRLAVAVREREREREREGHGRDPGYEVRGGSNAWVVSGARSASGRPLLASDPHLDLTMPSIWYEIHLSGGGLDVAGASLPGTPLVIIGRNRRIAWGATALYADVQDIYIETPNPENPNQYVDGAIYRDLDVVPETIAVKGEPSATEEVRMSRHGRIVGDTTDGRLLARRWDSLFSGDHILAMLRMNQAGSWQEFTDALRTWASPPVAFVYADAEGNIGFFPAGEIPVRTTHDGSLPVDGASGAFEWQGTLPHELKPMAFNPESGMIVSANHQMLPAESAYLLNIDGLADFRAARIESLLAASRASTLTVDDFERIQNDRYDPSTDAVLRHVVNLAPTEPNERLAVTKLRNWSGQMTEGPAPAIYQALYRRLIENALADDIGPALFDEFLRFVSDGRPGALHAIVHDASSPFWDDRTTPVVEDRTAIFARSLEEAILLLTARLGGDMDAWSWRELHAVEFQHPLAMVEPLRLALNRGPSPFGGSTFTVANAAVSLREPFATTHGTSFRFVTDLGDITKSRWTIPTGASGHPLSPHYFDQNAAWLEGRSQPMHFDRAAVDAEATGTLLLSP